MDEDIAELNERQRVILCARQFHSDVASAVLWLRDFGVDITCVRLVPYADQDGQLFVTSEIIIPLPEAKDYIRRHERKVKESKLDAPWSGYYFVNVGEDETRNWDACRKYGFVGADGGRQYTKPLEKLKIGDRFFAYMKGLGYVGFGEVVDESTPINDFIPPKSRRPLLEHDLHVANPGQDKDDPELCEYDVGVRWIKAYPREEAKTFKGIFANQNIVCKLREGETLDFLMQHFDIEKGDQQT